MIFLRSGKTNLKEENIAALLDTGHIRNDVPCEIFLKKYCVKETVKLQSKCLVISQDKNGAGGRENGIHERL